MPRWTPPLTLSSSSLGLGSQLAAKPVRSGFLVLGFWVFSHCINRSSFSSIQMELLCWSYSAKNCIKLCLHLINKIFDFGGPSLFACGECSMVEVILFLNPLLFFLLEGDLFMC